MNSTRSQNPFYVVALTVGFLGLLSLIKPGVRVAGVELRPVHLLADVLRPKTRPVAAVGPSALPPPNGHVAPADPLVLPAPALTPATRPAPTTPTAEAPARVRFAPTLADVPGLEHFLAALRRTRASGQKTRIAYFGDSMIEGDLLTGDLRNLLQTEFGGSGVGFVPMNAVTADFRETVHATFSPDWYEYNLLSDQWPADRPLGVSGHAFLPSHVSNADSTGIPADTSWVQFRAGQRFVATRRFATARLFYGPGGPRDRVLATTDGHRTTHALGGAGTLNELLLRPAPAARQLRLAFVTHGPRVVYGVSLESPGGVLLDNFSFRSNSGTLLLRIPAEQLAAFGRAFDYRLVVLHYGVNVARDHTYGAYEQAMTRVVERMQHAFPRASILVVGMSDKSTRRDGAFVTDPQVPLLLAAQQRVARRTHAAFWNLFAAMGGENSMTRWVEQSPPLAHKDYTHINALGGRHLAQLLYAYLVGGGAPATHPPARAASTAGVQ